MTICCGDSHTSTHGALGAVAFGIGTSQVRDVLSTQTLAMAPLKVRRIRVTGKLGAGVYAKDVILHVIRTLGVNGGTGFAYEYAGDTIERMSMDERMTLCNMSIEGGARVGYVNPDEITFAYLKGRPYAPKDKDWERAVAYWKSIASDTDAVYDDDVHYRAEDIAPSLTWGVNPGQVITIEETVPAPEQFPENERPGIADALKYMQLSAGAPIKGTKVDVTFIGSCTNSRLSDLREVAKFVKGKQVKAGVKALVVPGSQVVKQDAEKEGLHEIFTAAGFEWREPGCSMCLGMNPDRLVGDQLCASSSNRNFKGRMGSPTGRTVLMSPVMVAAAAIRGELSDAREVFGIEVEARGSAREQMKGQA
jgi:3-isopropylmalate/(R)-2-methylmalate dehydratase large subunit